MPIVAAAVCCTISGNVHAISGAALSAVRIEARAAATLRTSTDARGDFTLSAPPGTYRIDASERGYGAVTITVRVVDRDVAVQVALEPLDSPKFRQVGSVTVDGRLTPIRGALPSATISRSDFDADGDDRIIDGLQQLPGATFSRPNGGAASAVSVVSLRGPDPSESLIALDGQLLNDGNTGDLDLSRLPVAAFSAVDVTEGLGPEDSNGSNTFGGAIDLISLRPTKAAHQAVSFSGGSFGRTETWFNATGTQGRFGYAAALDDQNENGYVNRTIPLFSSTNPACAPCAVPVGSTVGSHALLGTATWSFSQNADVTGRVFVLGDDRDESAALNGIDRNAADAGMPQFDGYTGSGEETFAQTLRAYQLRGRAPLGAGELSAAVSLSDDNVAVTGGAGNPYDLIHRDERQDGTLVWQRTFAASQFAVGGYTRHESLDFIAPPSNTDAALTPFQAEPALGQTIDVLFARGGFRPVDRLRIDAGAFESRYTTFGSNLDGRFGAIFDADATTALRFSLGTGFRAPLLAERYVYPYAQLPLDGNNVFTGQGSPNERPEHATEYELGASHAFGDATLDASVYRTNLRDPVEVFYPLAAVAAGTCANNTYATPTPACVSYQSNVGNAVYEGTEIRYTQRIRPAHLLVTARYGLNVAYPKNLDAQFSNPTSGGNLVNDAQFLGIPQQQGSLSLDYANAGWHATATGFARGNNNELAQGPFAIVNAAVGRTVGGVDVSLAGTNLTSAVSGPFTRFGAGEPYRGVVGSTATGGPLYGPLTTDALYVEPIGIRLIVTLRR